MSDISLQKYLLLAAAVILACPLASRLLPIVLPLLLSVVLAKAAQPSIRFWKRHLTQNQHVAVGLGVTGVLLLTGGSFFLLITVLVGTECGSLFVLIASSVYYFSGSAPGPYAIPVIVGIAVFLVIFRQSYLQQGFFTILVCAALGMLVYEMCIFCIGLFLERTMLARAGIFATTALLSLMVVPVAYPILMSIGKLGGDTWKE